MRKMRVVRGAAPPRREGCSQPVAHIGQWEARGPLVRAILCAVMHAPVSTPLGL